MTQRSISLEEMRRKTEAQLEQKSQLEAKAGRILQFVLTVTSILVAGVPILSTTDSINALTQNVNVSHLETTAGRLSNAYPIIDGNFVVWPLVVLSIVIFGIIFYLFFIRVPSKSYSILEENDVAVTRDQLYSPRVSEREARECHSTLIQENEATLDEDRERWVTSFKTLKFVLLGSLTLIFNYIFVFIHPDSGIILIAAYLSAIIFVLGLKVLIPELIFEHLLLIQRNFWMGFSIITAVITILVFWISPSSPDWLLYLIIGGWSLFSACYPLICLDDRNHRAALTQSLAFLLVSFTFFVAAVFVSLDRLFYILISLFFLGFLISAVGVLIGYVIRLAIDTISNVEFPLSRLRRRLARLRELKNRIRKGDD